ncbi:hypothetical protein J7S95_12360 [Providencia stuartii]|uniref:hypothetical protein n=1 Tax=Providencia TaxID=586 RepID=UPI0012B5AE3D|nr:MULTISPECIES: hypothetical protein [Providencia]MBQ0457507.1 hypothetical protein [Providencia stuartii]MTC95125.1 hypothetical protein [Providencia stuartii]
MTEKGIQKIALVGSRALLASIWYDTSGMSNRRRLYAKARELIVGDRAEMICQQAIDKEQQEK